MVEQLDMLDAAEEEKANTPGAVEEIGCCSRYRECSDSGKCISTNPSISMGCQYRKNLEGGHVFYGENALGFSKQKYKEIRGRIDDLRPEARTAFDELVLVFCEYERGVRSHIVRNVYVSEFSEIGLFDFSSATAEFLELCSYTQYLRPMFKNIAPFKEAQKVRQAEVKQLKADLKAAGHAGDAAKKTQLEAKKAALVGPRRKQFLLDWARDNAPSMLEAIASPYRVVTLHMENEAYLEQYYNDALTDGFGTRIYSLSALAEDGVLSPLSYVDESIRRINMSRGYPKEEGAIRLKILQMRREILLRSAEDPEDEETSSTV